MQEQHTVKWIDRGREPQCPTNPAYPQGVDLDATNGATTYCTVMLPYPAKRCGFYDIECNACGFITLVTTAGRPDDPRSVRLACRLRSGGRDGDVDEGRGEAVFHGAG